MGANLGKFQNLEDLINKLLLSLSLWIKGKIISFTPSKVKKSLHQGQELSQKKKVQFKERVDLLKVKSLETIIHSKQKAEKIKERSLEVVDQARQTDIRSLSFKKILFAIGVFIAPTLKKWKLWYLSLRPSSIATFVSLATIGTLASVNIYVQSNKISEEAKRAPASELVEQVDQATAVSRRPAYYKKIEKQFQITNIVLPAYLHSEGPMKKLVIDFTFESSNKYIKEYFWQNPHLIQDTLNSNIEPISINFPLQQEGKIIVKEKIKSEMNGLLKRLKIKGDIKNVYIHSMIGG